MLRVSALFLLLVFGDDARLGPKIRSQKRVLMDDGCRGLDLLKEAFELEDMVVART